MIATSTVVQSILSKIGGLLNIAAGTKEENSHDEPNGKSVLTLVQRNGSRPSNRAFRIGVSDDVFARRDHGREKVLGSIERGGDNGLAESRHNEANDINAIGRVGPVLAFAAAGLLLGYLLGRHSRK